MRSLTLHFKSRVRVWDSVYKGCLLLARAVWFTEPVCWQLENLRLLLKLFLRQRGNMKVALCLIACLHVVVVVGMASGRHQPLQHHSPVALHDRRLNSKLNIETLRIPGSRHPPPRQPDVRGNDFLRMRGGSHNAWKGNVHVCDICPASEAIAPCTVSRYPQTWLIRHMGTFSVFSFRLC